VLLLAFGLCVRAAPAANDDADDALLRLDAERVQAMIRNDGKTFGEYLSDQLVYGHSDGRIQSKPQLLAALASNKIQYRAINYVTREIHVVGDNRVITGIASLRVADNGKPLEFTLRFTAVYIREGESWRLGVYQSTPLASPKT
jgi:ketosteroid isomerase-like protein